jgi:hypothetical protein
VVILGGSIAAFEARALVIGILHDHGDAYECALDLILDRLATARDSRRRDDGLPLRAPARIRP